MPVMGPNKAAAEREGNQAFEEIMAMLREKHNVSRPPQKFMLEHGDKAAESLRIAVVEMVWAEHCASF